MLENFKNMISLCREDVLNRTPITDEEIFMVQPFQYSKNLCCQKGSFTEVYDGVGEDFRIWKGKIRFLPKRRQHHRRDVSGANLERHFDLLDR